MTRAQMIAWLTLEGWLWHPYGNGHLAHVQRPLGPRRDYGLFPCCLVVIGQGVSGGITAKYYPNDQTYAGFGGPWDTATDEQVQLIYQEIVKHEQN